MKIPIGQTCSYSDIAKKLENAGAVCAVGSANGANQIAIVIPCHRVINSDGQLGGYGGGETHSEPFHGKITLICYHLFF